MTTRRLMVFLVSAIALAALLCVALTSYWERKQPVFKDAPKLISAMQAFTRDLKARGQPLPASVSLRELVKGGYIAGSDVKAFEHMDVTISLTADEESNPQRLLMWARLPDGSVTAALGDGSVQVLSAGSLEKYLRQSGQSDGPANGGQPSRAQTNRTSSAAGSRH